MKMYAQSDKLGRELAVEDCVAYNSFFSGLTIGRVVQLNRVRVRIQGIGPGSSSGPEDIQSRDVIQLDSKDVSFYLLKN